MFTKFRTLLKHELLNLIRSGKVKDDEKDALIQELAHRLDGAA